MKSNNVIFLDIDGVVNTLMIDTVPFKNNDVNHNGFYYDLCMPDDLRVSNRQAIMWINRLCKETHSDIVISSTWRLHGLENIELSLRNSGLLKEINIIGMTPIINNYHIRGDEIRLYLCEHKEIDNFIIIDDDSDMGEYTDRLVKTNTYVGFTYNDYVKALHLLNN